VAAVSDYNLPDFKKTVPTPEEPSFKFGRRTICLWERNDTVLCGRDPRDFIWSVPYLIKRWVIGLFSETKQ